MATLKFEAIAKAGTYKDRDGNEKTRFQKCGVVFESAKGLSLKIEALPVPFDGWLSLREPLPKDKPKRGADDPNDAVPF